MVLQTCSGFLEEKTNTLPVLGATSAASPKDVVYAIEPSDPYRMPIPKYRPKLALVFLQ